MSAVFRDSQNKKLFLQMLLDDKNETVVVFLHLREKCLQFNEILLSLPSTVLLLSSHSQIFMFALSAAVHTHSCTHVCTQQQQHHLWRGWGFICVLKSQHIKKTIYYCCHCIARGTQAGALHGSC